MQSSLRDIERQLVMHYCSGRDLLRFARCCKATLRAAASTFAWRHVEPLTLHSLTNSASHASVAMFAPLRLMWRPARPYTERLTQEDVDRLLISPLRIQELDASCLLHVAFKHWMQVLQSPWAQQLRGLCFHGSVCRDSPHSSKLLLPLILGMQNLQTLTLGYMPHVEALPPINTYPASLTSLTLRGAGNNVHCPFLPHFSRCPLRFFSIQRLQLEPLELSTFLLHPNMCEVQSLSLNDVRIRAPNLLLEQYERLLRTLSVMRCLSQIYLLAINSLFLSTAITALVNAVALREVVFENMTRITRIEHLPKDTVDPLASLLQRAPHLTLTLIVFAADPNGKHDARAESVIPPILRDPLRVRIVEKHAPTGGKLVDRDLEPLPIRKGWRPPSTRPFEVDTTSSLRKLAKVEVQRVMHCLSAQDRLRLARCCRTLLSAADDPFAWKHAKLRIRASKLIDTPPITTVSLTRHIPISLFHELEPLGCRGQLLRALAARPHLLLHELDASLTTLRTDGTEADTYEDLARVRKQWLRILARPALHRLHTLHVRPHANFAVLEACSRLPSLTHLSITVGVLPQDAATLEMFSRFRLHTLHLVHSVELDTLLGQVSAIRSLKRLMLEPTRSMFTLPSLLACLDALPKLTCELVVQRPPRRGQAGEHLWRDAYYSRWCAPDHRQMLAKLVAQAPGVYAHRIKIVEIGADLTPTQSASVHRSDELHELKQVHPSFLLMQRSESSGAAYGGEPLRVAPHQPLLHPRFS